MSDSRFSRFADSLRWWFGFLAASWLVALGATIAVAWLRPNTGIPWTVLTYAWITLLASFVAMILYGVDKRRAIKDRRRIPERVLHATSLVGGWPGAYLAQQVFRHKTSKRTFRMMFWLIVALHAAAISFCVYHWLTVTPTTAG